MPRFRYPDALAWGSVSGWWPVEIAFSKPELMEPWIDHGEPKRGSFFHADAVNIPARDRSPYSAM
jgi:hypothetical protein